MHNHFREVPAYRRHFPLPGGLVLAETHDGEYVIEPAPRKIGFGTPNAGTWSPALFKERLVAGAERLVWDEPARDQMQVWFQLSAGESGPITLGYRDFPQAPYFTNRDWHALPRRRFVES